MDIEEQDQHDNQENEGNQTFSVGSDKLDISYDIDKIKGIAKQDKEKEKEKKPRKKAEPKEKFTPHQLIQNKGIPQLITQGRRLYLRDTNSIVLPFDIQYYALVTEVRQNYDNV